CCAVVPPLTAPPPDTQRVLASTPTPLRGADVVIAAVGVLAERGADARREVLRLVVAALPTLHTLTLRTPGGAAVSESRLSPPGEPGWGLDVPVRGRGGWSGVLSAVSREPFTAEEGRLLR